MKRERRGTRKGLPMARPAGTKTPCYVCAKVPDRSDGKIKVRADAADLQPHQFRAFQHYRRCKAVGRFPEDEIVEHNAGLFARAEAWADRTERNDDRRELVELVENLRRR